MRKRSNEERNNEARAEAAFKPMSPKEKVLIPQELEKEAFDRNRERLKAERVARERHPDSK